MKTVRTDGGGENFTDERLKIVRSIIFYHDLRNKIVKLNDHKGILNVFWEKHPTNNEMETIKNIWIAFGEESVNHYMTNFLIIKDF